MFEVTASWAAEAAACGLWLVGLLKIWSLTFQVRMSHRHWSHNCSCEITQARWEERTSEQTCGLDSVSDNTTVCACVRVCVCVCMRLGSCCFSTSAYWFSAATTCWNTIASSSTFKCSLLSKNWQFVMSLYNLPGSCMTKHCYAPFHCGSKFIRQSWQTSKINLFVLRQTKWIIDIKMDM